MGIIVEFALPPTYKEAVRKLEVTGNISAARDEITSSPGTPDNSNDVTPERVMNGYTETIVQCVYPDLMVPITHIYRTTTNAIT